MKLDCSSDTDSGSETDSKSKNTYSSFEENSDNVQRFIAGNIVEKKITKPKVNVMFKDAVEMFRDDIKELKKGIYINRRQVNAYHEIKASLSENDLMLHVDFTETLREKCLYSELFCSAFSGIRILY